MNQQITLKGAVYFDIETEAGAEPRYMWFRGTPAPFMNYVPVAEHTIVATVADGLELRAVQIKSLEAQREKASADFTETMNKINEQISKLQAIEYAPEAA